MLDREFTKHGRHSLIVERPIPRVENMTEFYNLTWPSHFINRTLVRKRGVHAPTNWDQLEELLGPWAWTRALPTLPEVALVLSEGLDLILDPPEKLLKEGDHTPNHHLGHLLGVLVLDHGPDQDLLPTSEVSLDLHPTADPPQGIKHTLHCGKGKLHKPQSIRKTS